jgi:hypothetical protein
MDSTNSLFEHIKNRLPTDYGLGDDGTEYKDNIPNHKTWQQTLRENYEGDVGIFENSIGSYSIFGGQLGYKSEVQIAVVTKNGDIDSAINYLKIALENIKKDVKSTGIYVSDCKLVNLLPLGKNSVGLHLVSMNIAIKYAKLT